MVYICESADQVCPSHCQGQQVRHIKLYAGILILMSMFIDGERQVDRWWDKCVLNCVDGQNMLILVLLGVFTYE